MNQTVIIEYPDDSREERIATRIKTIPTGHVSYDTWEVAGVGEWSWYSDHMGRAARNGDPIGFIESDNGPVKVYSASGGFGDRTGDAMTDALLALAAALR